MKWLTGSVSSCFVPWLEAAWLLPMQERIKSTKNIGRSIQNCLCTSTRLGEPSQQCVSTTASVFHTWFVHHLESRPIIKPQHTKVLLVHTESSSLSLRLTVDMHLSNQCACHLQAIQPHATAERKPSLKRLCTNSTVQLGALSLKSKLLPTCNECIAMYNACFRGCIVTNTTEHDLDRGGLQKELVM
jgi:hypothetical protein